MKNMQQAHETPLLWGKMRQSRSQYAITHYARTCDMCDMCDMKKESQNTVHDAR